MAIKVTGTNKVLRSYKGIEKYVKRTEKPPWKQDSKPNTLPKNTPVDTEICGQLSTLNYGEKDTRGSRSSAQTLNTPLCGVWHSQDEASLNVPQSCRWERQKSGKHLTNLKWT